MPTQKQGTTKAKTPVKAVTKAQPSSTIKDDIYEYKENEFEQIRQCLGMYIGSGGLEGALHLINEIVTNSIDELTNESTIGANIWFTFMEKECKFIIEDDGRGIPLDIMYDVINKKHFSTKFNREFNRYSGGQNGVGTTITAALSSHFFMRCSRDGQCREVYMQGDELIDGGIQKIKGEKHGTYTEFIPSQKYLGAFVMTQDEVEDYLRRLSYILPENVKIKYLCIPKKGKEVARTYKRLGISANVEYLSQTLEFPPIYLSIPEVRVDNEDGDDPDYFKLEFAFSYDRTLDGTLTGSFCNYLATKEGGYHEQVVLQAVSTFFVRQAKALDPNSKFDVTNDDCKKGLIMAVNCDHSNPNFEGQHKSKVDQKNILTAGRKPVIDALTTYFESNNGLLRRIVQYLRQIARIRQEAHKIKNVSLKKPTSFLDDAEIGDIFINISDRNYTGYKELIIAEGDSAISAIGAARNVKCQAVFAIRGVVPNTYGVSTTKAMEHVVYQKLVKVLGCGIGKDFDITKLKWNAIILCTDADVDGDSITSILSCTFFACHLPELVKAGKLYKVVPPLYRINTKSIKKYYNGRNYLFDKGELNAIYHRIIAENMDLAMVTTKTKADLVKGSGDVKELSKKEKIALFGSTTNYLSELKTLQKRSSCNMEVLEYVCFFKVVTACAPDPQKEFSNLMKKKFPELSYSEEYDSIMGSYQGDNISLIVDRIFYKMASRMMRIIAECPVFYVLARNKNAGDDPQKDKWDLYTYGQFLDLCNRTLQVDIEQRYKGIGESDASMIFPSMMNPKTRKLIRITMDNAQEAMETIRLLHGDTPELRESRRKLLADADITLEDIDN